MKRESNIETILSQLQTEDFNELYAAPICASFSTFHDALLITEYCIFCG